MIRVMKKNIHALSHLNGQWELYSMEVHVQPLRHSRSKKPICSYDMRTPNATTISVASSEVLNTGICKIEDKDHQGLTSTAALFIKIIESVACVQASSQGELATESRKSTRCVSSNEGDDLELQSISNIPGDKAWLQVPHIFSFLYPFEPLRNHQRGSIAYRSEA